MVIGTGSYLHIHEPGDESERLNYAELKDRTDYILSFVIEAANRDEAFDFTGDVSGYYGVIGFPPTDAELQARNVDLGTVALKVSAVIPGMSGNKAGIVTGDLITEIDGNALEQNDDGYFSLSEMVGDPRPDVINATIVRESTSVNLQVATE